jgi:hypothetical protein
MSLASAIPLSRAIFPNEYFLTAKLFNYRGFDRGAIDFRLTYSHLVSIGDKQNVN